MPDGDAFAGHAFSFRIDEAINDQVIAKIESTPIIPLSDEAAPKKKGVYLLYHKGILVYAGKAMKSTLATRLGQHAKKISGRKFIRLDEMTCRFITIDSDWFCRAAEDALISSYKPLWNKSGFGSKIEGRGRPGMPGRVSRWNKQYPPK
jgi:hypothetical protein